MTNLVSIANTITMIGKIGVVELNNEVQKRLDTAQEAYDSLDDESKSKITNYTTLTNKLAEYKKLEDNKDKLLSAKEKMEEGNLNSAKKILTKLPKDFSYNGTKVSNLLNKLNNNSQWVELCGRWTSTGGRMTTKQTSKSYGSWDSWYHEFEKGDCNIDVRCKLNNNGTVTVVTSGSIPIYTSYSVISAGVDESTHSVSSSEKMTSYGTIKIDRNTSLTVSASGLSVLYIAVPKGHVKSRRYFPPVLLADMSLIQANALRT